jgi:hypothetical protein
MLSSIIQTFNSINILAFSINHVLKVTYVQFALTVPGIVGRNVQIRAMRNKSLVWVQLPLPLAMCKVTSRTFSTYGKGKKVQEQSRSRRFWKYDVIEAYIEADTKSKESI